MPSSASKKAAEPAAAEKRKSTTSAKTSPAEVKLKKPKPEQKSPEKQLPEKAAPALPATSNADFYEAEDREARETGTEKLSTQLLAAAAGIRDQLRLVIDGKELTEDAQRIFVKVATLKRASRLSYYANAALKRDLSGQIESVEAKYMQLQNVSSEIQHLQREIQRCLSFNSADDNIELVDVEEFYANAPESISRPSVTRTNEHEQRLARLTYEMSQRKQLVATLAEQEGRRNVLISDINGKEQRLKSLKPKIEALIKSARPVQEVLGVRASATASSAEQRAFFALLPPELSVLYVQAEAYKDIVDDSAMCVSVAGDAEEAARLAASRSQTDPADDDSDDDGSDERPASAGAEGTDAAPLAERSRRGTVCEQLESKRAALITPHPIYILIEIGCVQDVKVRMKIQYLPELRVSTLKWKVTGKLPSYGGICVDETLFDDLLPGDSGEEFPNPVGAAKLTQLKVDFTAYTSKLGRPYKFMQRFTGSGGETSEGLRLADVLQSFICTVRSRVASRVALACQCKAIESTRGVEEALAREGLPALSQCKAALKAFKAISEESYLKSVGDGRRELCESEGGEAPPLAFLSFSFEHSNKKAKMMAFVAVFADHPRSPPLWTLSISNSAKTHTAANSILIKRLEAWLNVELAAGIASAKPSPSSPNGEDNALLLRQLSALWGRLDTVLLSAQDESTAAANAKQLRSARGRDGELPLKLSDVPGSYGFK